MTAFGSMMTFAPSFSITSSNFPTLVAQSMEYSMPAQPPFLMPIFSPITSGPLVAMMAATRLAAASVMVMTASFGRGELMSGASSAHFALNVTI